MATNFPTSLDSLVNPTASDSLATVNHADQHANANDAIEALQAKVGINSSAVTTSLDYLVRNINASTAIVSGSSAGDLVRITQTGNGNALVVEDSANPDSTPFVITGSGIVKVLTPNSYSNLNVDGSMAVHGANTTLNFINTSNTREGYVNHSGLHLTLMNEEVNGWTYLGTEGANRFVISPTGNVGIGTGIATNYNLGLGRNITGGTTSGSVMANGQVQSDVTNNYFGFQSAPSFAAGSYTTATVSHFTAAQGTLGAGAAITNQIGFRAFSTLSGATNNFGFYGDVPNNSGNYNLYMNSATPNYLAGSLGIGNTSLTGRRLVVGGNLTGAVASVGLSVLPTIQSDVTTSAYLVNTIGVTTASAFTLDSLHHFRADQQAFGAGSTVNTQYGFIVGATLVGATTNYGFYSNIPVGTGRWNLYMNGTADNYMAGRLGVGATLTSGSMMRVTNTTAADIALTVKGAASQTGLLLDIENSAGTSLVVVDASGKVGIGTSTPATPAGYGAITMDGTTGSLLYQYVNGVDTFRVQTTATSATLNTIAAIPIVFATNNVERMRLDTTGALGLGSGAIAAGRRLVVSGNLTGAVTSVAALVASPVQSDVTNNAYLFNTIGSTAAASFTLANLQHFRADQGTFGAGSTVTEQMGFVVGSSFTGATNNYGFYGNIASGTGRWNLYMGGTADNYLAGNLLVGMTTVATSSAKTIHIGNGTAPTANPASGGVLYVESGALKYRGSSGTVTTIANA